jgi:RNA polymerase sigma-70 factor (ECF subfamily)
VIEIVQQMTPLPTTKPDALAQARAGDKAAFEALVTGHERLVLRTAWRLLGNREDTQDAAQEVFLRLYKGIRKLREDTLIEAWLYRVTLNVCQDLRRKRRSATRELIDRGQAPTPEHRIHVEQQTEAMTALIAELPDKERAALVLREIEGLSTREVAGILGSSEVTVRTQVSSARSKLKAWIAEGRKP